MKVNVFAEPVNKVRKPAKPPKQPKQPKQPKKSSGRQQHIVKTEYAPQEDMHMLIESEHEEHHEEYIEPEVERYPVIDPARPFVCQRCGVSFAREKALLSHSKVSFSAIFRVDTPSIVGVYIIVLAISHSYGVCLCTSIRTHTNRRNFRSRAMQLIFYFKFGRHKT